MSTIDDVKARLDIVETVRAYAPDLKKAGRTWKARCPFHSEKTPSFNVDPERQTWHCFGACSTGGDVIEFVRRKEGLDFKEALRLCAERAGVELRPPSPRETEEREQHARDERLARRRVVPDRQGLPRSAEHDLLVRDEAGHALGTLAEILETPGNHIFVVRGKDGETLIPATKDAVAAVDLPTPASPSTSIRITTPPGTARPSSSASVCEAAAAAAGRRAIRALPARTRPDRQRAGRMIWLG